MKIYIGSDHAGFEQKEALKSHFSDLYTVIDMGPETDERCNYPDYAFKVCEKVASDSEAFGILVCGTGIGMAISANKVAGIRAANCINADFARLSRQHNNANVITVSGRFVPLETNKKIIQEFIDGKFEEGRHSLRLSLISEYEKKEK